MTDGFVNSIFTRHGLDKYRDLLSQHQFLKQNLPKTCAPLVHPFTFSNAAKTSLSEIAQSTADVQIGPLPIKNVECYQMSLHKPIADVPISEAPAPVVKSAPVKRKSAEARPSPVKRLRPEKMIKKRSPEKESTKPPSNLTPIITKLFDEFWDMELPPLEALPFFSFITPKNCESLGFPGYFDKVTEACTFYNIKEKLEKGLYVFPETFEYDFMMCFDNVIVYFPHDSPQRKKAIELRELFMEKWAEAKRQMK